VSRQQGLALVLVLWVLSLLTIMAGSFTLSMRREAAIASGLKDNAQALAIAESGISLAEVMLMNPDATKRWRSDGSIYHIDVSDAQLRIRVLAESGKIDINSASEKLLRGFLANAPVLSDSKIDVAAAIVDWRDSNDEPRPQGAEKKHYKEAGLHYAPRNKAFQSLDELQLVLGMNESLFNWLTPFITVYSGQPKVNMSVATPELLQLLPDIDPAVLAAYIQLRNEAAILGLPAPQFVNNAKALRLPDEKQQSDNAKEEDVVGTEDALAQAAPSETVTILAEVLLHNGASATLSALVERGEDGQSTAPYQVLQWQRNPSHITSLFVDSLEKNVNSMTHLIVKHYAEPELND
jgi:general secretion pathway protein K